MRDGSRNFSGLREEWSLLVHSIIDDTTEHDEKNNKEKLQQISLEQINTVKRELSQQRKALNIQIESIKHKIEHSLSIIENLELVGSNSADIKSEIEDLNEDGQKISTTIAELDMKLNKIRDLETKLIELSEI